MLDDYDISSGSLRPRSRDVRPSTPGGTRTSPLAIASFDRARLRRLWRRTRISPFSIPSRVQAQHWLRVCWLLSAGKGTKRDRWVKNPLSFWPFLLSSGVWGRSPTRLGFCDWVTERVKDLKGFVHSTQRRGPVGVCARSRLSNLLKGRHFLNFKICCLGLRFWMAAQISPNFAPKSELPR
jgi:hypothetical protein